MESRYLEPDLLLLEKGSTGPMMSGRYETCFCHGARAINTATRNHVVGCRGLIQPTEFRQGRFPLPGTAVDLRRPASLKPSLLAHRECFLLLFPRRDQGASYTKGLLSEERRKSIEHMALQRLTGNMNQVRRLQYFVADSPWSDQPFLERHWQETEAVLGTREGSLLVGTTDMPKQGVHSAGVARQ